MCRLAKKDASQQRAVENVAGRCVSGKKAVNGAFEFWALRQRCTRGRDPLSSKCGRLWLPQSTLTIAKKAVYRTRDTLPSMAKRKNTGLIVGGLAALGVAGAAYLGLRKSPNTKGVGCGCSGQAPVQGLGYGPHYGIAEGSEWAHANYDGALRTYQTGRR